MILCQPDSAKSCCACCGLFNYNDLSRESLERFLGDGAVRSAAYLKAKDDSDAGDPSLVRDITSYVCPHQGFLAAGRPGCLLHPLHRGVSARHSSFFGEKICDSFLCPAHSLYSDGQKDILIGMIDDWYFYTIAIIDPASVLWLFNILRDRFGIRPERDGRAKKILLDFLAIHASHLRSTEAPLFFYSAPEYRLGFVNFSLGSDSPLVEEERSEVLGMIRNRIGLSEPPGA